MADGVVFLRSYYEAIKELPPNDQLILYDAIIRYGLYGEVIDMTPTTRPLFLLVKPNIDSSQNRYRAAKENGKKGGRPRKNQKQNQCENQKQNQCENQKQNQDKDMDMDSDSEKETDGEDEPDKRADSRPPTKAETELFLFQNKIFINPDRFYAFCSEIGWENIWDWRNLAKSWDKTELKRDSNEFFLQWRIRARERGLIRDG